MIKYAAGVLALLALCSSPVFGHDVISVHGSGTTNPSKCFWLIMNQMEQRAKLPIRLTYRAVGSSTGQYEFVGVNNTAIDAYIPYNHFGSGDIPIPTETYDMLSSKGIEIVHLPILLGGISFFHSIPNIPDGKQGLNLTSCVLARIMSRNIKTWDHADIKTLNPGIEDKLPKSNYPIRVARRVQGSSSTASITEYLHEACPSKWEEQYVGPEIAWDDDTDKCEGSGGMTACIRDNEGTIGYIDAGHGHSEGLKEIELANADGYYISSREADAEGGISDAAKSLALPAADQDYGKVSLMNQPGRYTWPIVAMTYVYVRKDLISFNDETEKTLLVAFLESLYDADTIGQCRDMFKFSIVPESVRDIGLAGIAQLQLSPTAPKWEFETKTMAGSGQSDYMMSVKRRSYTELAQSSAEGDIEDIMATVAGMEKTIEALRAEVEQSSLSSNIKYTGTNGDGSFTEDDERQLKAALALASVSMALWALTVIGLALKFCVGS